MPPSAPPQTNARDTVASVPDSTSNPKGVKVAAIDTLIIAWSSRPIQRRACGDQVTRWKSPLARACVGRGGANGRDGRCDRHLEPLRRPLRVIEARQRDAR